MFERSELFDVQKADVKNVFGECALSYVEKSSITE